MKQPFYQALYRHLELGEDAVLLTLLPGSMHTKTVEKAFFADGFINSTGGEDAFWSDLYALAPPLETLPALLKAPHCTALAEHVHAHEQLVILGGGHVARPLAKIGVMLGFTVTVVDERPGNAGYFPDAHAFLCLPYKQALKRIPRGKSCYYVIVTPGHAGDLLCLESVLKSGFAYAGMIGSSRKVGMVQEYLASQGIPQARIAQVHMPIGLAIGAQTPEEIAVSIAAELVKVRAAQGGGFDMALLSQLAELDRPAALATVVAKSGSAPRGIGARMLMDAFGRIAGTIGGGAAEAGVLAAAGQVMAEGIPRLMGLRMDNEDARKEGMICGGSVTVLLEPLPVKTVLESDLQDKKNGTAV